MNSKPTMLAGMMILAVALAACQKKEENAASGPAEQAGAQLDNAMNKATEQLNQAGEKAGQMLQEVGKSLENKAQEAQQPQEPQQQSQK